MPSPVHRASSGFIYPELILIPMLNFCRNKGSIVKIGRPASCFLINVQVCGRAFCRCRPCIVIDKIEVVVHSLHQHRCVRLIAYNLDIILTVATSSRIAIHTASTQAEGQPRMWVNFLMHTLFFFFSRYETRGMAWHVLERVSSCGLYGLCIDFQPSVCFR